MMLTESSFKTLLKIPAFIGIAIVAVIFSVLFYFSLPSLKAFGLAFYTSGTWNPNEAEFGLLTFLVGTLITSIVALLLSIPFSLSIALFINYAKAPDFIKKWLQIFIDTLAGIPSIIYGFWGLFVLAPLIRIIQIKLNLIPYGVGLLTASIILTIMIIPLSSSLISDLLKLLPKDLEEAAVSLGATQFETIRYIMLPMISKGMFSAFFMAFGRAMSETMAVTMVIGNFNQFPSSIFSPSNTLSSVIANEFAEAVEPIYISSLVQLGLILFFITLITGIITKHIAKQHAY